MWAFLVLVCNKTNYHPAFFALYVITTEIGVSLKKMFDFDKLCCFTRNTWIFVQFVLWMVYCMSYFHLHMFVWMISSLFVSYDKFLVMWLVSEFFRFSRVESVSSFFFATISASNWYYCVIWCISGEESPFVRKKATSGKPALVAQRLKQKFGDKKTF